MKDHHILVGIKKTEEEVSQKMLQHNRIINFWMSIALVLIQATLCANHPLVDEVVQDFFAECPKESISVRPLFGGCEALAYIIESGSKSYVFRIFNPHQTDDTTARELYAMQEAAKVGISPEVYYISPERSAVLIEYLKASTISIADAKRPENCRNIAQTLRKAHSIKTNPTPSNGFCSWSEEIYREICSQKIVDKEVEEAISLIRKVDKALSSYAATPVNIHGDLNTRNIFIADQGIQLIDWTYTRWEDPYYDLASFALFSAYDEEEELFLLECYLDRQPTVDDINRYYLTKQMYLANLSLNLHMYAHLLLQDDPEQRIDPLLDPKPWSYYIHTFAKRDVEEFPPQFHYEWSKGALNEALRRMKVEG